MAKNKIITSEGNVQFIFGDTGKVINVHPFHIYTSFNEDTVSFLLLPMPKSSGLAIFTSKAEDLEFDGVTYSFSELPSVIAEAFAEAGAKARWEIVQTLPASGRSNTIYLVPKESGTGYDEYIWLKDEQRWELIGDTDIELARYLKKSDFNAYSAATKDYIDSVSGKVDTEIERATSAETALSGAIDTVSSALTDEISARTEADSVISGAVDDLSTALANEVSARTSADTAFDERLTEDERVWGAALNDLNSRINTVSGDVASETSARTEADNALSGAIDTKFDASAITAYSTTVEVGNAIDAATSGKVDTTDFNTYSGAVETALGNKFDASGITAYSTSQEVTTEIDAATSGKVDTSAFTAYSASVETELSGKQGTLTAGRGVDITSDVISLDFPISAGTGVDSLLMSGSGNTASGNYSVAFGKLNTVSGECGVIMGNRNTSNNFAESAFGQKNVSRTGDASSFGHSGNTIFTVGNGVINVQEGIDANHNAFEIRGNGDIYIADTNATGGYYEKPMIKLQDAIGGGSITIDPTLDSGSTNAVANSAITEAFENVESRLTEDEEVTAAGLNALNETLSGKQDVLVAGENITISGNVISAQGGGGIVESAITSGSTNAVEGKAIWSATTFNKGVLLTFNGSRESTNYPEGCGKLVVGNIGSYGSSSIDFRDDERHSHGNIAIDNRGNITVDTSLFEGATATVDGNTVTIIYPSTDITLVQAVGETGWTYTAVVEGAWVNENTYMKVEVDAIASGLQNNINSKLDATAYTPTVVDSALNVASQNPVQNQALYSELIFDNGETETTLTFEDRESTNYPNGCTKLIVEVVGVNRSSIDFFNDTQRLGNIMINNFGDISVDGRFDGATYEISGTTVIITYPTVTSVTKIFADNGDYVYKAITSLTTHLKDQVVANTTALGAVESRIAEDEEVTAAGLNALNDNFDGLKLKKITQAAYDALTTKDASTLYIIIN